jgi:hypothetical protein
VDCISTLCEQVKKIQAHVKQVLNKDSEIYFSQYE